MKYRTLSKEKLLETAERLAQRLAERFPSSGLSEVAADLTQVTREALVRAEVAPADKRIYALRDVTATVESIPLIVASILSKKLAEGIDGLVLDVKVGKGAFMKSEESARALADKLVRVGTRAGKKVVAVLTRMDAPLGRAVGNVNETREALEVVERGECAVFQRDQALESLQLVVDLVALGP